MLFAADNNKYACVPTNWMIGGNFCKWPMVEGEPIRRNKQLSTLIKKMATPDASYESFECQHCGYCGKQLSPLNITGRSTN